MSKFNGGHVGRGMMVTTLAVLSVVAGCSDDKNDGAKDTPKTEAPGSSLEVTVSEFKLELSSTTVAAGDVSITGVNAGTIEHEIIIIRSDLDSSELPLVDGRVPEDEVDMVDEISEFAAGTSATQTFNLTPGRYVLICNLPAHYTSGMHHVLEVTG